MGWRHRASCAGSLTSTHFDVRRFIRISMSPLAQILRYLIAGYGYRCGAADRQSFVRRFSSMKQVKRKTVESWFGRKAPAIYLATAHKLASFFQPAVTGITAEWFLLDSLDAFRRNVEAGRATLGFLLPASTSDPEILRQAARDLLGLHASYRYTFDNLGRISAGLLHVYENNGALDFEHYFGVDYAGDDTGPRVSRGQVRLS